MLRCARFSGSPIPIASSFRVALLARSALRRSVMKRGLCVAGAMAVALAGVINVTVLADDGNSGTAACKGLPTYGQLRAALVAAAEPLGPQNDNGGFGLNMWGTVVNRDGVVCAVAFTGSDRGD